MNIYNQHKICIMIKTYVGLATPLLASASFLNQNAAVLISIRFKHVPEAIESWFLLWVEKFFDSWETMTVYFI